MKSLFIALDRRLSDDYLQEKAVEYPEAKRALEIRRLLHIKGMSVTEQIVHFLK